MSRSLIVAGATMLGIAATIGGVWLLNQSPGQPLHVGEAGGQLAVRDIKENQSAGKQTDRDRSDSVLKNESTNPPTSPTLLSAYANLTSGRAFVNKALSQPEAGGIFYVRALLAHCLAVRGLQPSDQQLQRQQALLDSESDGILHQKKSKALQVLRQQCSDFTDEELKEGSTSFQELAPRDPLVRASQDLLASLNHRQSAAARGNLAATLAAGDPVLLDQLGVALLLPGLSEPRTVYFAGRAYPHASEVIGAAVYLLPCHLGLNCTAGFDLTLALDCANGEGCWANRSQRAREAMTSAKEASYLEAEQLARQMADAVRRGDVAAFLAPP